MRLGEFLRDCAQAALPFFEASVAHFVYQQEWSARASCPLWLLLELSQNIISTQEQH